MKVTTQWARDEEWHYPFYRHLTRRITQIYQLTGRHRLDPDTPEYADGLHWARQWEYPWAVEQAQLFRGIKALDVGCGLSPFLIYLGQVGCKAYGSDPGYEGPDGLWGHREDFGTPHVIEIRQESMSKLSWQDESFDVVFCLSVLNHVNVAREIEEGLEEMKRVLKLGGKLILTLSASEEWGRKAKLIIGVFTNGSRFSAAMDREVPATKYSHNILGMVLEK